MPSSAEVAEEKLTAAIKAVAHVLEVISTNPKVAYHLGHCTESYALLCEAMAVYKGMDVAEVQEVWSPASPDQSRDSDARTGWVGTTDPGNDFTLTAEVRLLCEVLSIDPHTARRLHLHARRCGIDVQDDVSAAEAWIAWVDCN